MRIQGRVLRPQNLAERRILKSLGIDYLRVPRRLNPFAVARLVRRLSFGGPDMSKLQHMLRKRPPTEPVLPDSTSTPAEERAA